MKCIICGNEEKESDEHIIPEALGNKKLITKRVCEFCNNRLGSNVDSYLTNHPLVKIIRINSNLRGKKEKNIKLFGAIETDIHTGKKYDMTCGVPKIIPRLVMDSAGKMMVEAASYEEGLAYSKKTLKRKGYSDDKIEYYCGETYSIDSNQQAPEFRKDVSISIPMMDLAAIKVAYEYAHLILGDDYLEDEIAKQFRQELYHAVNSKKNVIEPDDAIMKYVVFPISGSGVAELLEEQRNSLNLSTMKVRHTLFFIKVENALYCILNLCMTDVISFAVRITENASKYSSPLPLSLVFDDGSAVTL